jgi:hypothetical protein
MKMKAIFVMLLLTVSIFVPILAASTVHAVDVPPSADNPPTIYWQPGGIAAAANLEWNPEFLKLVPKLLFTAIPE